MSWSDILKAVTDNPLDTIEGILKIRGAIQASNQSSAADDASATLTAEEISRNNEISALYAEGGTVLEDNLSRLLEDFGSFGQITPERMDEFKKYLSEERSKEESANVDLVDGMTEIDEMRLKGYETAFRDYAEGRITNAEGVVYGRDDVGQSNAPGSMDFAQLQDSLTTKFWGLRSQNTARDLDKQYARVNANIPEGMENSTLRVQMERQFADLSAERSNKDMLSAVGDAQQYISGLQSAASNQQNMTNAERNMERNLVTDTLNYGTGTLTNSINSGTYGQGLSRNINSQRGMAVDEVGSINSMRNNTALSDYLNGLSTLSAENKGANAFIGQVQQYSTAPYTYAAAGQNTVDNSNAFSALSDASENAAALSAGNTASAGKWYNDFNYNYL